MKKIFRKFISGICAALVLTLMCGSTVLADGRDTSLFDFGQTVLTIPQGGSAKISLYSKYDYTYYITGQSSKKTYLDTDYKSGSSYVTFHVGADEKVGTVTFYFYVADRDGTYDSVQVNVVAAGAKANAATTAQTTAKTATAVPFTDGTAGSLTLVSGGQAALVSDAAATPLAAFSLTGTDGKLAAMTIGAVVNHNGANWLTVNTAAGKALTINIGAADKAAMTARGIGGLCLNGSFVAWP